MFGHHVLTLFTLSMLFVGCAQSPASSGTTIEYRRTGGLLGVDDHLRIEADGRAILMRKTSDPVEFTLPQERVETIAALMEAANFTQLRSEYPPPSQGAADYFQYTISYQGHTVRAADGSVPEELVPGIDALNQIVENPPVE